jgi:hypothetical protein
MSENPGIFELAEAEEYLTSIGQLKRVKAAHCPAEHNDPVLVWQTYAINMANAYKYQKLKGDWYEPSCRGQWLDMPGAHQVVWQPDRSNQSMQIHEWPGGSGWRQCGKAFGDSKADWWYDPSTVHGKRF